MTNPKISELQVKINRLQGQRATLLTRIKQQRQSSRKARTRTLIQVGGLVSLTGLLEQCGIQEGEDLQLDLESADKAATLLGILAHVYESLPNELPLDQFKQKGIRLLKRHGI